MNKLSEDMNVVGIHKVNGQEKLLNHYMPNIRATTNETITFKFSGIPKPGDRPTKQFIGGLGGYLGGASGAEGGEEIEE